MINWPAFNEFYSYYDKELVLEIIGIFFQEYPGRLAILKESVGSNDLPKIAFQAHSLKGVVANFMDEKARSLALEMELKAKAGDGEGMNTLLEQLDEAIQDLLKELDTYREARAGLSS